MIMDASYKSDNLHTEINKTQNVFSFNILQKFRIICVNPM